MSGPIGRDNRRLDQLTQEVNFLRQQLSTLQARLAIDRPPQAWRFGVTAKLLDESSYPSEGSGADTFGVRFADLEFSPLATGSSTIDKHYRSAKAKIPARSLSGYIAEGTPVVAFWSAVPGAATNAGCWYIALAGSVSGLPIRFRLTSSISVFGSGNGVRQKWDSGSSDWIDDPDFPDTETLFDYVGSASSGDPNDTCFAVEMPDHLGVYEIVEIQQVGVSAGGVVVLELPSDLTQAQQTKSGCTVKETYTGGPAVSSTVVARNPAAKGGNYQWKATASTQYVNAIFNGTDYTIVSVQHVTRNVVVDVDWASPDLTADFMDVQTPFADNPSTDTILTAVEKSCPEDA